MPSSSSEALHYIERNINNLVEEIEVGTVGALCRDMLATKILNFKPAKTAEAVCVYTCEALSIMTKTKNCGWELQK